MISGILAEVSECFEETPYEINNGLCEEWANQAYELLQNFKVELWETVFALADTIHMFLRIDGKFYDAECLDGVEDHMQLPLFQKLFAKNPRIQPVVCLDSNYPVDRSMIGTNAEELKTAGYN